MGRWSAAAECYLVDKECRPLAGPFSRETPLIALINRLWERDGGDFKSSYGYGNASRYILAKHKLFARTKAGDAALVATVRCHDLEALVVPLLGREGSGLGSGYENPDWVAIDALLTERGILPAGPVESATTSEPLS